MSNDDLGERYKRATSKGNFLFAKAEKLKEPGSYRESRHKYSGLSSSATYRGVIRSIM